LAVVVGLFLIGHTVGFVLLAVALLRSAQCQSGPVRRWSFWPVAELVGEASGIKVVAATGMALLVAGTAPARWHCSERPGWRAPARLTVPASPAPITANGV